MDALDFELPPSLIATRPAEPRDSSRLLVCSRSDPAVLIDARFSDLPGHLKADDLLVFNRSAVLPARLRGRREDSGGAVEGLYLSSVPAARGGPVRWKCLLKSNGVLRAGARVRLHDAEDGATGVYLRLVERADEGWLVGVEDAGGGSLDEPADAVLSRVGSTPLPPYILRARKILAGEVGGESPADAMDRAWYQTVYADPTAAGSVAAPTAGLHFTPGMLERLGAMGVDRGEVLLHVGEGTFKPVTAERLEEHPMHAEWISVPSATIAAIEGARRSGGRSIAVGTTSCRALESIRGGALDQLRSTDGYTGRTDLLIAPGFSFRWMDGLITNFHLPRSTLLALVAALFERDDEPGSGLQRVHRLYRHAIAERYRFFSYGDAMLILP